MLKSGCHWRLSPHGFPSWSSVYYHLRRFWLNRLCALILKALRAAEWKRAGKDLQLTAAITDSKSVKTIEESAHPSGYDVHIKHERAQAAPSDGFLGLLLSLYVTPAKVQDRIGALLARRAKGALPRSKKVWADGASMGEKVAGWRK